ncbi:autotransporter outer membrane beta-barrel domain-containing protein [Campylobacter geochelonis]|uniref:autotransporter outer membrane beta-barrel domain-containing protein n=1 Tax=Campylobacter geochelonis TaxID=1780362 RepID=UPI00077076A7|nr:autotransporter outer membrane beta-barrel domain-containing protein [Campylobacter geochelonis]CZE51520.1 putative high-molecular-weight surface-exposed protein [Campylobacter geochelonis]
MSGQRFHINQTYLKRDNGGAKNPSCINRSAKKLIAISVIASAMLLPLQAGETITWDDKSSGLLKTIFYTDDSLGPNDLENSVSGNNITVNDTSGKNDIAGGVYGAIPNSTKKDVTNNTVTIKNGNIGYEVNGGFARFSSGASVVSNIVNVSGGTIKGSVAGGESAQKDAKDNEVFIDGKAMISGSVYGGFAELVADGNKVVINGGHIVKVVTGGVSHKESSIKFPTKSINNTVIIKGGVIDGVVSGGTFGKYGTAAKNIVTIMGGTIKSNVRGGANSNSQNGKAQTNGVAIEGGTIEGYVAGGESSNDIANENKVTITGGDIGKNVYGGYSEYGVEASSNTVEMSKGTVKNNIRGGYSKGSANSNTVKITGGEVKGEVYGGYSSDKIAESNKVEISNANIAGNVHGGYVSSYSGIKASSNEVAILSGVIGKNVYGGHSNQKEVSLNVAKITGGEVKGEVYGGYSGNGITLSNKATISNATIDKSVYGGYSKRNKVTSNSVQINSGTIKGNVYGGYSETKIATQNEAKIDNTTINGSVYGGYSSKGKSTSNTLTITNGEFKSDIYGGWADVEKLGVNDKGDVANKNIVNISGGVIVRHQFVTGGHGNAGASENIVNISGGDIGGVIKAGDGRHGEVFKNIVTISQDRGKTTTIKSDIYGGRSEKTAKVVNNEIHILGGTINRDYIVGGQSTDNIVSENKVIIKGGTINLAPIGGIFGAINSEHFDVTKNEVDIYGGDITSEGGIFGANASSGIASENKVNIYGGTIKSSNYGIYGGTSSKSASKNEVNIYGGNIVNSSGIYGGVGSIISSENKVVVKKGDIKASIYGGKSNNGKATSNTVEIAGGTIDGYIIGGFSANDSQGKTLSGAATSNTVIIKGTPNITNSTIYGGYNDLNPADSTFDKFVSGNTLNFYSKGLNAKNIANFENINFIMPKDTKAGDTMLTLNDSKKTDLSMAKVGVAKDGGGSVLNVNDRINLIKTSAGVVKMADMSNHTDKIKALVGATGFYDFKLHTDEKTLYVTVLGDEPVTPVTPPKPAIKTRQEAKSFLEGSLAGASMVNQGADMVSDDTLKAMKVETGEGGLHTFASMGGYDLRYETGSHVDAKGFNLATGVSSSVNVLNYGLFFEYGKGDYDSFNGFDSGVVKGSGDSKYYGLGVLFDVSLGNNYSLDLGLRAGRSETDYKSYDFSNVLPDFELKRNYFSAHIGANKAYQIDKSNELSLYAKLFYSRLSSDEAEVTKGEFVKFDSITSLRSKLGFRYNYLPSDVLKLYAGLAWEKEYDGKAEGFSYSTNQSIQAPELKGDSGVFEIGTNYIFGGFDFGLNVKGYVGDKKGVSGGVKAEYKF